MDIFDQSRKVLLHVGCGREGREVLPPLDYDKEWREVRVDLDPSVNPDVVASIVDLQGVPDNSVSIVFSKHNIEHVESYQAMLVLKSFYRVLRPDGFAIIRTPDLKQVAELILKHGLDFLVMTAWGHPVTPIDMLYGVRGAIAEGNSFMAHRTGFTADTLYAHVMAAGFEAASVFERPKYELGVFAQKKVQGNLYNKLMRSSS